MNAPEASFSSKRRIPAFTPGMRLWSAVRVPLAAVLLAFIVGAIILLFSKDNPLLAYSALFRGAFGNLKNFGRTLEKATPLLFSGLAVTFAFRAGLFNIGAQGQLLFGAIISAYVGFAFAGIPPLLHLLLALLCGSLAGAIYGSIVGWLKAYTGAHEVITTIMLNYVSLNITDYLSDGPWKDPTPGNVIARTPLIENSAIIPKLFQIIPLGFFIALLVTFVVWWFLNKTIWGYEVCTVGINSSASKYAGIKVNRTIILAMCFSGFLAGMGGAVETQGVVGRFQPGFNVGLGFDGIVVALLGRASPLGNVFAALLIGAMRAGGPQMQFIAKVPNEIIDVIQALILFFVAADLIIRWMLRIKKAEQSNISLSANWVKSA